MELSIASFTAMRAGLGTAQLHVTRTNEITAAKRLEIL